MYGLLYAIGIFACSLAQALGTHHNWGLGIRVGTHTRMVLMAAVMKKMLRLSPEARLSYSIGEMSNIVSVDAARIAEQQPCGIFFIGLDTQLSSLCASRSTHFSS